MLYAGTTILGKQKRHQDITSQGDLLLGIIKPIFWCTYIYSTQVK